MGPAAVPRPAPVTHHSAPPPPEFSQSSNWNSDSFLSSNSKDPGRRPQQLLILFRTIQFGFSIWCASNNHGSRQGHRPRHAENRRCNRQTTTRSRRIGRHNIRTACCCGCRFNRGFTGTQNECERRNICQSHTRRWYGAVQTKGCPSRRGRSRHPSQARRKEGQRSSCGREKSIGSFTVPQQA